MVMSMVVLLIWAVLQPLVIGYFAQLSRQHGAERVTFGIVLLFSGVLLTSGVLLSQ